MKTPGPRGTGTSLVLIGIALIVWNALITVLGLWQSYWWAALFGNFILIVLLAEKIGVQCSVGGLALGLALLSILALTFVPRIRNLE